MITANFIPCSSAEMSDLVAMAKAVSTFQSMGEQDSTCDIMAKRTHIPGHAKHDDYLTHNMSYVFAVPAQEMPWLSAVC